MIIQYIDLINKFADGKVDARHFSDNYIAMWKNDDLQYDDQIQELISRLMTAADSYSESPECELDIDEENLRNEASSILYQLKSLT